MRTTVSDLVDSGVPWIGRVPQGWQTRPLWSMFERIKDVDHPDEQMLSVFRDFGVVAKESRDNINKTAENRAIYQLVHPGWLVVNRMKAWQGSVGISSLRGIVSGHYICFAPHHSECDRYLNWLMRSTAYTNGYALMSRGVRIGQAEIDNDEFRLMPILLPPPAEQQAIADFLDRETARIDTLIAKQEELIATLRERQIGVIRASIAGVDSGLPLKTTAQWFGALPTSWKTAQIRYNFSTVLGKMLNSSKSDSNAMGYINAPYLAAGSIQPDELLLDDTRQMMFSHAELERYSLRAGDVVVVEGGAGYGRSHLIQRELEGWGFQNHVARIRPSSGRVTSEFLAYCLKACLASGYIEANNRTATLPSLSRDVLGAIQIPIPPVREQNRISNYLDEQTARIDALTTKTERFIELSKERRSALITAAVTGQMDVRGDVA